ncbi:unnamed protein product [Prorocentrum cordatum]|uniref:Uncharacterized protein n=1 Tax=Prorocentrum cordatum TaxID=2364126 RepID=A0ABN9Y0P5_9DINO|nr:unnamed protein product [Polarella glacialis]
MATSKHEKNHTTEVTYGRQRGHWDSFENCYGEKPGGRSDDDADEGRDAWSDPGDFDDHDAAWEAAEGEDWDDRPDPASLAPAGPPQAHPAIAFPARLQEEALRKEKDDWQGG